MERLGIRRNPAVLLVVGVLVLCLAMPGMAMAATKKVTLYAGSATQGTMVLKAKGLKAADAKWTSSSKVVVVKAGKATAKKAGKATVTAKMGKKTFKFSVTVKAVALSKKSATLDAGKTLKLKLKGDKIKSAKSLKTSVVTVKKLNATTVKVTAKAGGTAKVKVVSKKGKSYICKVTVKAKSLVPIDEAILGVETNSVVEAGHYKVYPDGPYIHLSVKDSAIAYETWSKSLKLKVADGYTYNMVQAVGDDWDYDGHQVTHGLLTLSGGGETKQISVEAFEASSGMYESTL